jgi:hypothetical protein
MQRIENRKEIRPKETKHNEGKPNSIKLKGQKNIRQ